MSHYPAWPRDALVSSQPGMSFPSLPGLRPQEVLKGLALPAVQREAPVLGGDGLGLMVCLGRIFRFSPPGTRCSFCLSAKFPECVCVHVCAHVGVRVCAVTSGHTTIRTRVGPPAPGSRGGYSPGPEPLSAQDPEHRKPESSREESKSRQLCPETQPSAPSARVPAPRPAHSGSGAGLRAQSQGRARGSTSGTHRPAAGVPDVAIGQGLVDGEAKVSPADVAHHLAASPDGLQAEQGHLPARESGHWDPRAPERPAPFAWLRRKGPHPPGHGL